MRDFRSPVLFFKNNITFCRAKIHFLYDPSTRKQGGAGQRIGKITMAVFKRTGFDVCRFGVPVFEPPDDLRLKKD